MRFIKLRSYQKKPIEQSLSAIKQKKFFLFEAPTGTGKTTMFIELTRQLLKQGKSVVLSTFTNQLALDLSEQLGVSISAGINNYFDPAKLSAAYDFIDKDDVISYLKNISSPNDYLLHNLFTSVSIENKDKSILAFLIQADVKQPWMTDFNAKLIVTNHTYLLAKLRSNKLFNIKDRALLIDEVDKLVSASDILNEHNFSLYRYRILTKRVLSDVEKSNNSYKGKQADIKALKHNYVKCKHLMNSLKNSNASDAQNIVIRTIKPVNIKRIAKESLSRNVPVFEKEHFEFNILKASIANKTNNKLVLSKEKGYPSFKTLFTDARWFLKSYLWDKSSNGIGASATLRSSKTDFLSAYKMLGIRDNYLPMTVIHSQFKRKAKIYIANQSAPKPTSEDQINDQWIDYITNTVIKTNNGKNSMILTGSFAETKRISDAIRSNDPELNIVEAFQGSKIIDVIREFKTNGGILIAPKPYKDGINLPGKELERLYLSKIPFSNPQSSKYLAMRKFNDNYANKQYRNETIRSFCQAIGRLIRGPKDEGNIYILDSRIYTRGRLKQFTGFLSEIGQIQEQVI